MSALPDDVILDASNGDLESVSAWLDAGGDVNAVEEAIMGPWTLLGAAVNYRRTDMVRYLLSRGAAVNHAMPGGGENVLGPLLLACLGPPAPEAEIVSLLLAAGADVDARDVEGWTPLGRYLYDGIALVADPDLAALLLRAGASLDNCRGNDSVEDVMRLAEAHTSAIAADEDWNAIKVMVAGVRAHGSWKAYKRAPHREVLRLRSLVARQRAAAIFRDDASYDRPARVAAFLCRRGGPTRPDNGVVWNILSYWNATA